MPKPRVMIVDDAPENVDILDRILNPLYRRSVALNGESALKIAADGDPPDLILLDINMPGMDGYEVCRLLKQDARTQDIPVIFITALGEATNETKGLELGAVDYITKPISSSVVLARIKTHLELKQAREALKNQNEILEQRVKARTKELALTQEATIVSLASLAETRDNETGAHIMRTQRYVHVLAKHLADHDRFSESLSEEFIHHIYKSAPLHDIGKVGIPDRILLKPGKLTAEEFKEMKMHTVLGRDAIAKAERLFGGTVDAHFLSFAREIAYTHHEKWDGSGYPQGLSGDDIPISGRLMALADVYDALISKRVYKSPISHQDSAMIIKEGDGSHFDPAVVQAFLALENEFKSIADQFPDHAS